MLETSYSNKILFSNQKKSLFPVLIQHFTKIIIEYNNNFVGFSSLDLRLLLFLLSLTEAFNKTYLALKAQSAKLEDDLLTSEDKVERRFMKHLIRKIDRIRPMNARGYFEIDKTTLTSILSIRF